jgi:uncharacterized protein YdeI (YjbR/CyaY-like superfamily)
METLSFPTQRDFRKWLSKNHSKVDGIWLQVFKKDSGVLSVSYAAALDEALCFGWIDGQKKPLDEKSWLQKFTPRRARSGWSKVNTQHAERLIQAKKMAAAGMAEIERAKADGRWDAAYDRFADSVIPDDFLAAVAKNKKAQAFFETLNKTNRFSISYRLQTAKREETRQKRINEIVAMLARGEKFH